MPRHYHSGSNASSTSSHSYNTRSTRSSSGGSYNGPALSNGPSQHKAGGTSWSDHKGEHDRPETVPPKDPANLEKMYDSCSKAAKSGGGHGGHHEGESGGVLDKVKNIIKK
ncbi:hypothetical protein BDZ90DRAFT_96798 [Jaminaea rosea]|uniref:Uncharacterized protein n=1 Tax=Jaminaea rosea TaxID=1569628 RepID=A0A316UHW9_9BASI|nr:hypothetical protein BDZ90DRAFT_96798 [Jaminaea rosea]PWN24809.1 hypothetical protein BDZ90DRAFT_96798 [Jaminaea rosea]